MIVREDCKLVSLPLTGEWVALNTPAERVPSHGTDYLAQTYAFDFVKLNAKGNSFSSVPLWHQRSRRHTRVDAAIFGYSPTLTFHDSSTLP